MRRRLFFLLSTVYCLSSALPASAHPLDVGYLDFGKNDRGELTLTVALHPYQAFELVREKSDVRFDLEKLQRSGDLVSAYAQDHVSVWRGGEPCVWKAESAHTPPTELEAVGDGVTIAGVVVCQNASSMSVDAESTLFLDGFPQQTAIIRLDLPEGYADRVTLDRKTVKGTVNVSDVFAEPAPTTQAPRRPDAPAVEIAKRFLDPGVGTLGAIGLLLSAVLIGALHALGPGHGKSLLAAVLVGERASAKHLLALGTVMTATHVSDVFLMAILAGVISSVLPPTLLLQFLQIISAVGLLGFGLYGVVRAVIRYRLVRRNPEFGNEEDAHLRAHALGLPHSHGAAETLERDHAASFRSALWTGFVGSLAPCPTAWAIFMATVSLGRAGAGLALLVAFTVGLYATVLAIGLLILKSKSFALRRTSPQFTYALPIFSSLVVAALGGVFLIRLVA